MPRIRVLLLPVWLLTAALLSGQSGADFAAPPGPRREPPATATVAASRAARPGPVPPRRWLGDLFVCSQVSLETWGGTLKPPGRAPVPPPRPRPVLVPIGSVVETGSETARLRFACGSSLELGPRSRLTLHRFSVEPGGGSFLVRHCGSRFPLRLAASPSLLLQPGSLVDLTAAADRCRLRVQAGSVTVSGSPTILTAGQFATVAAGRLDRDGSPPAPRAWLRPSGSGSGGPALDLTGFLEGTDPLDDRDSETDASTDGAAGEPPHSESGSGSSVPGNAAGAAGAAGGAAYDGEPETYE